MGVIRKRGAPSTQGSLRIPWATRSAAKSPYEPRNRGLVRMPRQRGNRRASRSAENPHTDGARFGAKSPEGHFASPQPPLAFADPVALELAVEGLAIEPQD